MRRTFTIQLTSICAAGHRTPQTRLDTHRGADLPVKAAHALVARKGPRRRADAVGQRILALNTKHYWKGTARTSFSGKGHTHLGGAGEALAGRRAAAAVVGKREPQPLRHLLQRRLAARIHTCAHARASS